MPEAFQLLPIDQLMVDPTQPRKQFHVEAIEQLSESMKSRGILTPLRVLWNEERSRYLIVCGESRYRAALIAKLDALPCVVIDGNPDEADLLADRIVENHCRRDLDPVEFAQAISKLKKLKGLTAVALGAELGISSATITRAESLLTLPEQIQAVVGKDNGLSESAAYTISRLETPQEQFELAEKAIAGGWSRAVIEEAVHQTKPPKAKPAGAGSKLALKLSGIGVNFTADRPLKWADLLSALERMQVEAKRLADGNKSLSEWAKACRVG